MDYSDHYLILQYAVTIIICHRASYKRNLTGT